jgi:hypothetical protein
MEVVLAVNAAEVAEAGIVTDVGMFSAVLVSPNVTTAPPPGATPVSVTVHVLELFCGRVFGLQRSDEIWTDFVRLIVVVMEFPL